MRRPRGKKPRQRAAWVACDLGEKNPSNTLPRSRTTQAAHDSGRALPRFLSSGFFWFFFFFFFSEFSLICSRFFSIFIRVVNQVLETRFLCGRHMEKYATLDHIKPWKSSLKDLIYRPKSSLLDSRC